MSARSAQLRHVPRLPPGLLERDSLLERLSGPAPLVVLQGHGGMGKTTLLACWARAAVPEEHGALVWIEADEGTRTRTGFWMRVLGRLHAHGLLADAALYREMASIADHPDTVVATMRRVLGAGDVPITLLLDDVGSTAPGTYWDPVCRDLVELLRHAPQLRCIAAGRVPTPLSGPLARSSLQVDVLDDADLRLDAEEVRALVGILAPELPASVRAVLAASDLLANPASRRIASLRFALDALRRSPRTGEELAGMDLDALLADAARREARGLFGDAALHEFVAVTARAPLVDAGLAQRLTGRADASGVLDELEHLGAGQWEQPDDSATPVFRYSSHIAAAVTGSLPEESPRRRREVHREISRWLAEVRGERLAAFEHALRADDLSFAEQLLMRLYPLPQEDAAHVSGLLRRIPALRIHRHPMLAMWFALSLNKHAATQRRAVEFFVSASFMGTVTSASTPPLERAVRQGVESAVHRLLGRPRQMRDLAHRALPVLEEAVDDLSRDRSLDGITMAAINQCGMSLFYAELFDDARTARLLQVRFAEELRWGHQRNEALANLAMIHAFSGELGAVRETLAMIRPEDWPQTWRRSYMDSPEHIARAWAAVAAGAPQEALDAISGILPHLDTIEHWDLIAGVRALALAMSGSAHEAQVQLRRTVHERVSSRTLPSSLRRLDVAEGMLHLALGGLPDPPDRGAGTRRRSPMLTALRALTALAEGRGEDAVPLLAEATLSSSTALHRMTAAVIEVVSADAPQIDLDLVSSSLRMAALLETSQVSWPLVLLPASVRESVLTELLDAGETASAQLLREVFERIPALVSSRIDVHRVVPHLTSREREVLLLLVETGSRTEIAARLFVSVNTVKTLTRSLYAKLGARTREQALAAAIAHGLIRPVHLETHEQER